MDACWMMFARPRQKASVYLLSRAVLYPMASGLGKVVLLLWDKGNGFPMGWTTANNFRFDVSKL